MSAEVIGFPRASARATPKVSLPDDLTETEVEAMASQLLADLRKLRPGNTFVQHLTADALRHEAIALIAKQRAVRGS